MAAGRLGGSRSRRVSLPGVAELLRPAAPDITAQPGRQASGREAHPQKITVYLSAEEYLDLERARLMLRARGIRVDRGRLVREAIAVLLADLQAGADGGLVARRLAGPPANGVPAATSISGAASVPGADGVARDSGIPAAVGVPAADGVPALVGVAGASGVPQVDGVLRGDGIAASGVPRASGVPGAGRVPRALPAGPL